MIDDLIPNKAGNLLARVTGRRAKGMLHILQSLKSLPIIVPGNIHNKSIRLLLRSQQADAFLCG